jgi:hypothetical protein
MTGTFQAPNTLKDEIIAEAQRDYLGLWWIVHKVREHLPGLSVAERRTATLDLLRPLLESRELVAGEPSTDGRTFSAWGGNASEVLARIEEAWSAGSGDPDIGNIVWLTSPS